ncbi:MAG: GNAT family N-acetyltransferase [Chloroflexota bacterium]
MSMHGTDSLSSDEIISDGCSSPQAVTYKVYGPDASPNGFEVLADEWNQLLQKSRFNSFFLTHEWQTTWWRYLGTGDLWIVAFYDQQETLVGIVPLYAFTFADTYPDPAYAGKRQLTLVGCIEVSDYLDAIIAAGWEEAVYRELYQWLMVDDPQISPVWDILDLCNLPQASQTYQVAPALYSEAGCTVTVTKEDVAPQFVLPMHYETYLREVVDKKQRHEIRRKQRRVERETTADFYVVGPEHDLQAEMDDFIRLQRASREDKAEFMTPEMERFFRGMAQAMLDAGYLRLLFLRLNGENAATVFAFEHNGHFLLYNSGYQPDIHAHLSPGWVLLAYGIQYAIARGCKVFDFMQGDEAYKYRFGCHDYDVMRVVVRKQ